MTTKETPKDPKAVIPPAAVTPPASEPANPGVVSSQTDDIETDDLGYPIVKEASATAPKEDDKTKKPDLKVVKDEKEETIEPSTGYGKEPPEVVIENKPPPAAKPDVDLGFELKIDPIIPKDEVSKIKDFAKKHNLTQQVAQEYFDLRKSEVAEAKAAYDESLKAVEKEKQQIRATWHKELRDDPVFGGDKFEHNVQLAEKVLAEVMPGTKKALTDKGSMLPPYVMRDLAKLGERLYSTEKLTQGEPTVPPDNEKESDDPLAFYGNQ